MKHRGTTNHPAALVALGPLVEVLLSSEEDAARDPAPTKVSLMVDTGAECTVLEDQVLLGMGLSPIGFYPIVGVSQKPEDCPVYAIHVGLKMREGSRQTSRFFAPLSVIGMPSPAAARQHVGLLGRDFLAHVLLRYDGPRGEVELERPSEQEPGDL